MESLGKGLLGGGHVLGEDEVGGGRSLEFGLLKELLGLGLLLLLQVLVVLLGGQQKLLR